MDEQKLREHIFGKITELKENGYAYIDLVDIGFITEKEILRMQEICMNYYYKYFTDRGLALEDIEIDLTKKMEKNPYFKQPKDSPMFKAMYGAVSKAGKEYINTRRPANAMGCGMGKATSAPEVYHDKELCAFTEKFRPLYNALYQSPVKRHLARFGLKLPHSTSRDMMSHVDMCYCKEYRDNLPKMSSPDDPKSFGPYADDGRIIRVQSVLGLSNSSSGWYGYEKSHTKYSEIGDALGWPGIKHGPQPVSTNILKKLGLQRVDIPTKIGRWILWNSGIVHGNSVCKNTTPRLVKYLNFRADEKDTTADKIIGLGNQPNEK
jgi:hypothetical protein